jgi:hypothetical protein
VDDGGDGRGALTAAGLTCGSCGTYLAATAEFCSECGSPAAHASQSAEYKQVTVLFADVVRSMEIAATVGPERLREIMVELVGHAWAHHPVGRMNPRKPDPRSSFGSVTVGRGFRLQPETNTGSEAKAGVRRWAIVCMPCG